MTGSNGIPCIVCGVSLTLRTARGRKSGKPFLMLICPADGRHFRGFIKRPGVRGAGAGPSGGPDTLVGGEG